MRKKRIALILVMLIFSVGCLIKINNSYDVLARYPYTDYMSEESGNLIREHLDKNEIEYIIEYAIAPAEFIKYIETDGFNIYDIADYNKISNEFPNIKPAHCVKLINLLKQSDWTIDICISYLYEYTSDEIILYLQRGECVEGAQLAYTPARLDLELSASVSVGYYQPKDLIRITSVQTVNNEAILLRKEAQEALLSMCEVASEELKGNSCGGMLIKEGYKSWEEIESDQMIEYAQEELNRAGHNEHQLGLAVDFMLLDEEADFSQSKQLEWLLENSRSFGFIANSEDNCAHFRYVGKARALQE